MQAPDTLVFKLSLAVVLGGIIGIERELRSKSAGFRTMILICLGAALFTILSQYIGAPNNTDRIASNIVVGIGFLGAGVIFRGERGVSGITTAATIWLTAAMGMGVGCGYYQASLLGCGLVLVVLFLFSFMDDALDKLNQVREYKIVYPYVKEQHHKYEKLFKHYGLTIRKRTQCKHGEMITGRWVITGNELKHHKFIDHILGDDQVKEFDF